MFSYFLYRILPVTGIILLLAGCSDTSPPDSHREIRDGLYQNEAGHLCFQVIDKRDPKTPGYIESLWSHEGVQLIDALVDSGSFQAVGSDYYKDRNRVYFFWALDDGGTLSTVEGADPVSFKIFEFTQYAMDQNFAFYRGAKIEQADPSSFAPVDAKEQGRYAKDNNHYYQGEAILSPREIDALKAVQKNP